MITLNNAEDTEDHRIDYYWSLEEKAMGKKKGLPRKHLFFLSRTQSRRELYQLERPGSFVFSEKSQTRRPTGQRKDGKPRGKKINNADPILSEDAEEDHRIESP